MKKYRRIILVFLACLALAAGSYFWANGMMDALYGYRSPLQHLPPAPGDPAGSPVTNRVVFVLIDALRTDTAANPTVMPYLNELRSQGASATMHSRPPSFSEPGYSTLLTGAWPEINDGPALNLDYDQIPTWTQDNLFSAAHRAGLTTAVSGYYWFEKLIPQKDVTYSFYTSGEDRKADEDVLAAALPMLKDNKANLVLIHIDQVDYAGHHEGGPVNPNWNAAASRADQMVREIAGTLDFKNDTLVILSDHGQIDQGGHGGQDPETLVEPFIFVGKGVIPGKYGDIQMVDVAPTLAVMLGLNIPATAQGEARVEMVSNPSSKVKEMTSTQQLRLLSDYETAIRMPSTNLPAGSGVDKVSAAMTADRELRLNSERVSRFVQAGSIALLPAVWLLMKRNRKIYWLLGAGLLYLIFFNFRYAVIDHNTYSLSSVKGTMDLILYCAATAGIALAIAMGVYCAGQKPFKLKARQAAEEGLWLTLMTIYLLALPVLYNYAVNGLVPTWTLPEFGSMFMGFLSLVQILMVSVIGMILSGLLALSTIFFRKKD